MQRAKYQRPARAFGRPGRDGLPFFLQQKGIPLESAMAKSWNLRIFKKIRREADAASYNLAVERGACPMRRKRA